jgi:hypothetical protein
MARAMLAPPFGTSSSGTQALAAVGARTRRPAGAPAARSTVADGDQPWSYPDMHVDIVHKIACILPSVLLVCGAHAMTCGVLNFLGSCQVPACRAGPGCPGDGTSWVSPRSLRHQCASDRSTQGRRRLPEMRPRRRQAELRSCVNPQLLRRCV